MKRTLIKHVLESDEIGSQVKIAGWVRTRRDSKAGLSFAAALRSILRQDPNVDSYNPRSETAAAYHAELVWAVPFSLATTQGIVSFPRGTKMFQFPRFPPSGLFCSASGTQAFPWVGFPIRESLDITPAHGLPRAFRSVPRPSSAFSAKASTICS